MTAAADFIALRPAGGFGLIMADPPWLFELRSEKGTAKSPQNYYACMKVDEIARLPVPILAAPDCLLWLWTTGPMLRAALGVLDAWHFDFKTMGWWSKKTVHGKQAFGTGYVLRAAGEPFLIASRGAPKTTRATRSTIEGVVREHSRKPEEAYAAAEALMPGAQRIELFSRQRRSGWATWGDQVEHFEEGAA